MAASRDFGSKGDCTQNIYSTSYQGPLLNFFGAQLMFPAEFVGRGDMSRGGFNAAVLEGAHPGNTFPIIAMRPDYVLDNAEKQLDKPLHGVFAWKNAAKFFEGMQKSEILTTTISPNCVLVKGPNHLYGSCFYSLHLRRGYGNSGGDEFISHRGGRAHPSFQLVRNQNLQMVVERAQD